MTGWPVAVYSNRRCDACGCWIETDEPHFRGTARGLDGGVYRRVWLHEGCTV